MFKFFALMSRMKYIERWGLMRSTTKENIAEHSLEVAMIAHCLALKARTDGKDVSPERVALKALYHEASEVITGDMPAPIKYNNEGIRDAYKKIERQAGEKLLGMLPASLVGEFEPLIQPDPNDYEYKLVKAADKLSALIKCVEELKASNAEFSLARKAITHDIAMLKLDEADYFVKEFLPAYEYTLDTLMQ